VLYAIGNSGQPHLIAVAQRLVSDADPTVAEAAVWAVGRLSQAQDQRVGSRDESC
jgi:epoxyqueuosine reductase